MTDTAMCDCGKPLHYRDPNTQRVVEQMVEERGTHVDVVTPRGTFRVPRHFIALHGLREFEIPNLAELYGWERT